MSAASIRDSHFETSMIHFPTSEGVSEVSERANEWVQQRARAKRAVKSKQTSERCERMSEWTTVAGFLVILDHNAVLSEELVFQQVLFFNG